MSRSEADLYHQNVESLINTIIYRLEDSAASLRARSKRDLNAAAKSERDFDFQTYSWAAGTIAQELQNLLFNLPLARLIKAASEAEVARGATQNGENS